MYGVGLGGVLAVQVVWGEYCDSLLCSFLLGFWGADGACMVVDIEGGSGGDIMGIPLYTTY